MRRSTSSAYWRLKYSGRAGFSGVRKAKNSIARDHTARAGSGIIPAQETAVVFGHHISRARFGEHVLPCAVRRCSMRRGDFPAKEGPHMRNGLFYGTLIPLAALSLLPLLALQLP